MSGRRGNRGKQQKFREEDGWRVITESPEANAQRREKQSQNRKSRREDENARRNIDQLTISPGLSRNSGSSSVPVPFVRNSAEKNKQTRGGKRSRSRKPGVGTFDPSNPSGNFAYRQSPPGYRGRGRGGAPRGGRGGHGIYIHGHGYVGGRSDMDEVSLESTSPRFIHFHVSYL